MRFLTTQDLADLLNVSTKTVQRWRSDGTGPPFYYLGAIVRYRESEVIEWLKNKRP